MGERFKVGDTVVWRPKTFNDIPIEFRGVVTSAHEYGITLLWDGDEEEVGLTHDQAEAHRLQRE